MGWLSVDKWLSYAELAASRSGQCAGRASRWAANSAPALHARPSSLSTRIGGGASTTPPQASTARAAAWPPSTCPGPPANTSTWCPLRPPPVSSLPSLLLSCCRSRVMVYRQDSRCSFVLTSSQLDHGVPLVYTCSVMGLQTP